MIIYNVTVNVEDEIHEDWLNWMKTIHIPDVMRCNLFESYKICKIIADDEGHTYSIQYNCKTMKEFTEYQSKHAPKLQKEHSDRYKNRFVAFRTIMEEIA